MVFCGGGVCDTVEVASSPSSVFKLYLNPNFPTFVRLIPR